jgi:pilus assembly protein CpaF
MSFTNPFTASRSPEEKQEEVEFNDLMPADNTKKFGHQEEASSFDDYFSDDEETVALKAAKGNHVLPDVYAGADGQLNDEQKEIAATDRALDRSFRDLKTKYPAGGIKASRFITADILMSAPPHYFDRFEEDVEKAVRWVQTALAGKEMSDVVSEAMQHPTDDAIQEQAFRTVMNFIIEFMERMNYRGVDKEIVKTMVSNEIIGFGKIDPLWRDRRIDEILANGPRDIQVEISGQLQRVPACRFRDERHMMNLLERLFGAIGKTVTRTTPLVKGRLHDNSRMFAVHSSVAPLGPNFSIRRHPEKFWTPADLVERGSASEELMTSIGNLIYKGCSFVVIGGTSTGKTSLLNAMTGFYRNDVRLLTLEDNLEMKPNPKKLLAAAMECKPGAVDRPNDKGITMRDLVKASLQLRPDGIIVGEVTDGATYDLCQALNTGHFGASTIHANSEFDGIYRIASLVAQSELVSADGALPLISAAFDFIIQLEHFPIDGSRRIVSISEVAPYPVQDATGRLSLPLNRLWKFVDDGMVNGKVTGHYEQVGQISEIRSARRHLTIERDLTWPELKELSSVPAAKQKNDDAIA